MASFVASRAARATRFPHRVSMAGNTGYAELADSILLSIFVLLLTFMVPSTLKGNDMLDNLQADIAALKTATLTDAGPILLRLLQSMEFREYAVVNGLLPAGVRECNYTYTFGGVIIVDTPTRPSSPTNIGGPNFIEREGPEGSSPASTHRNISVDGSLENSYDVETDMLAYLKGVAIVESICGEESRKAEDHFLLFVSSPFIFIFDP
jgi:hypothetical protein